MSSALKEEYLIATHFIWKLMVGSNFRVVSDSQLTEYKRCSSLFSIYMPFTFLVSLIQEFPKKKKKIAVKCASGDYLFHVWLYKLSKLDRRNLSKKHGRCRSHATSDYQTVDQLTLKAINVGLFVWEARSFTVWIHCSAWWKFGRYKHKSRRADEGQRDSTTWRNLYSPNIAKGVPGHGCHKGYQQRISQAQSRCWKSP